MSMRDRINASPSSSTPGATVAGVHPYVSPMRKWAVGSFVCTAITAIIFSCLAVATYVAFSNLVSDLEALPTAGPPLGVPTDTWTALFDGAATSAIFAVVLTVLNIVMSVMLLCCSRLSVAHPQRTLSKSFLAASNWFAGLHVANITSQFYSFRPLMNVFTSLLAVSFNTKLLGTTVVFGILNALFYFLTGLALVGWVDRPDLLQVDVAPAGAMRV